MSDDDVSSRDEQARQTKARIRRTALKMFAQQGYAATSVRSIADEAGVSEGLVFHHFSSKKGLMRAVGESERTFADAVSDVLADAEDRPADEALRSLGQAFVDILGSDTPQTHLVMMMVGESQTNPEAHELFRNTIDGGVDIMADYLRARIAAGELRDDLPVEASARSFFGSLMLYLLTRSHLDADDWKDAANAHVEDLVDHWLEGARA